MIHINLANDDQQALLKDSLDTLPVSETEKLNAITPELNITALVDGRGLACPMPLLKTKVALRTMKPSESVYI